MLHRTSKELKKYFNYEFPPLKTSCHGDDESVSALFLMPPLHTILLGPVNDVLRFLKGVCDLEPFLRKHHIKGSGKGGDYNGPTIKDLITNEDKLSELREIVGEVYKDFVEHLTNISVVHKVANAKELNL